MFIKNLIVLLIALPLVAFAKPIATAELKITEQPIFMQIDYFSTLYGVDSSIVKAVVRCESQGNPNAVGDGHRSHGIAQFQKETFLRHEKLMGEDLNYESSFDQIKLLSWAIANDMGREWTTYRAIKNGGVYRFHSEQLNKDFTVVCKL